MKTARSSRLFTRAQAILPGGVDSPVRAFKSVGAAPLFIKRAAGSRIEDVDGNTFIDYVMSWGPLIHGHAPKALVKAVAAVARDGTSVGAVDESHSGVAVFGALLAGAAGAIMAPIVGVVPTMGVLYIARAFITVVVSGATLIAMPSPSVSTAGKNMVQ